MRRAPATKISAVISDIDGTLVTDRKVLTERSCLAAEALGRAGIAFSVISSRPPRGTIGLAQRLGIAAPFGCFNGGLLAAPDSSILEIHSIAPNIARVAVQTISASGAAVWLFSDEDWFLCDPLGAYVDLEKLTVGFLPIALADFDAVVDRALKIVGVSSDPGLLGRCEVQLSTALAGAATVVRSQPYYLDITDRLANKGTAVLAMARLMSIPIAEIAVIGDGFNDVAMFEQSGLSIAMGNARAEVKARADFVTDKNSEDGFAKAIDRIVLGGDRTLPIGANTAVREAAPGVLS